MMATASASTAGVAAEPAPDLTIAASPRWGANTANTWTPYLVTVANRGLDDFDGEVVLIPDGADRAPAWEPAPAPGGREVSRPPVWPHHRTPLTLGAGGDKTFTTLVMEAPGGHRAELRHRSGRVLGSVPATPPAVVSKRASTVALLSKVVDGAERMFTGQAARNEFEGDHVTTRLASDDFPDNALDLSGLDAVVIDDFGSGDLTTAQLRALQDFVGLGGSLVLGGGATWRPTLESLPGQLVPFRPSAAIEASLAPLADVAGQTTPAMATIATGQLEFGRSVVHGPGGPPLIVEADYGAGRVVQLTYDPLAEPFASDTTLGALSWNQVLSRAGVVDQVPTYSVAPPSQLWSPTLHRPTVLVPSLTTGAIAVLGAYLFLVGPLGYLVLRALRRQVLTWAGVPLGALVLASAIVLTGAPGTTPPRVTDTVVAVRTLGPDGTALVNTYHGIAGVPQGEPTLRLAPDEAATTVFPDVPEGYFESKPPEALRPSDADGGEIISGDGVFTTANPSAPGQLRTVQTLALDHDQGQLEADLRLSTPSPRPPDDGSIDYGVVTGTVTNRTGHRIRRLRVHPPGRQAVLAEAIEPGVTIEVNAPMTLDPALSHQPQPSQVSLQDRVTSAAASFSFTRANQLALSGVVEAGPDAGSDGGRRTVIEAVVQPVPFAGPDGPPGVFVRTGDIQVQVFGARQADLVYSHAYFFFPFTTRVFDVSIVPGSGPVWLLDGLEGLTEPPYPYRAEVYDWASGSWRALPPSRFQADGSRFRHALNPGEIDGGLVRVRTYGHGVPPELVF